MQSNPEFKNLFAGPSAQFKLLKAICESIAKQGKELSDCHIEGLYNLFGEQLLLKSLNLVDKEAIEHITTPTGRTYFVVRRPKKTYTLYCTTPYCDCLQFQNNIRKNSSKLFCKHIISCNLALATGKCQMRTSTEYMSTDGIL
ncbi:Hypothetical protein NTJ_10602 [Nesidiocoris tenuis]|uniref:SWIM-type domain-containing protein n=1 Tax=Nesidiocoris tenuis TaxID=355587 RepID=A0ABN7B0N1_9HEMI|nr:Hypothetical protein NTJ_10602 [Nesidiocoris tenuis]